MDSFKKVDLSGITINRLHLPLYIRSGLVMLIM